MQRNISRRAFARGSGARSAACWHAAALTLAFHHILHGWFVSSLIDESDGRRLLLLQTGSHAEEEVSEGATRAPWQPMLFVVTVS